MQKSYVILKNNIYVTFYEEVLKNLAKNSKIL